MALKRTHVELRTGGNEFKVSPDEQDRYEIYTVINPAGPTGIASTWFGTWAVAGTSAVGNLVIINAIADYPRNLEFAIAGSAAGMTGTAVIVGKDQFGNSITESLTFAGAANGGTVVGTKVFDQVTSGVLTFGTAVGNGTARLGVDVAGTTALFGLPVKIGAASDVVRVNFTAGTGALNINGGTIATYVNTAMHAIKAPKPIVGTTSIQAWVKSSYSAEAPVANATQRT